MPHGRGQSRAGLQAADGRQAPPCPVAIPHGQGRGLEPSPAQPVPRLPLTPALGIAAREARCWAVAGRHSSGTYSSLSASERVGQGRAGGPAPRAHGAPLPTGPWEGCRTDGRGRAAPSASVTVEESRPSRGYHRIKQKGRRNTREGPGPPPFYEAQRDRPSQRPPGLAHRAASALPRPPTHWCYHPRPQASPSMGGSQPRGVPRWARDQPLLADGRHQALCGLPSASSLFCPRAQWGVSLLSPQRFPSAPPRGPQSLGPQACSPAWLDPATGAGL